MLPRLFGLGILLVGCGPRPVVVGDFEISSSDDGALQIEHALLGPVLEDVRLIAGAGSTDVNMQFGAFLFEDVSVDRIVHGSIDKVRGRRTTPVILQLRDKGGDSLGTLTLGAVGDTLIMDWAPDIGLGKAGNGAVSSGVVGMSAACDKDDHFMGLGSHAFDIDHVGEAFTLWVQEPGIGKNEVEEDIAGWPLKGARHDTSFPVPVLVRPQRGQALIIDDTARVDVDLCASDSKRFEVLAWRGRSGAHVCGGFGIGPGSCSGSRPIPGIARSASSVDLWSLE